MAVPDFCFVVLKMFACPISSLPRNCESGIISQARKLDTKHVATK